MVHLPLTLITLSSKQCVFLTVLQNYMYIYYKYTQAIVVKIRNSKIMKGLG